MRWPPSGRPPFRACAPVLASSGLDRERSPFESTRDVERCTERRPCPSPGRAGSTIVPPRAPGPWIVVGRARLSVEPAHAGWRRPSPRASSAREPRRRAPPVSTRARAEERSGSEHRRRLGRYEVHRYRLTTMRSWWTRRARALREARRRKHRRPPLAAEERSEPRDRRGRGLRSRLHRHRQRSSHEIRVLATEPLKTPTSLRPTGRGSPAPVRDMAHEESPPTVRAGDRVQTRDGRPSALEQQRDPPVRVMRHEGPRGPPARAGAAHERAKRAARRAR